ncbi:MAG: translocation/assembly module TamB domain-containing protein [Parafilimonas sp.]|nr:translocation/assembly module TamB domain-containing protein [Parafilimonas sp.]
MDAKKVTRKIFKVFAWIIGIVIFLILLVYILIQVPGVQNFAKNKVVSYVQGKIKTKVAIGKLSLDFPKRLVLENVYFEDQKKDTLLYGGKIRVDISLFKLLSNEVDLQYLELNGIKANIYRNYPDTSFNYDYIVKAFASSNTTTKNPQDTSAPMKFNIGKIVFKNILAKFKDDESGSNVYFYLGDFNTSIRTFDPDKQVFSIKDINVSDINAKIYQYKPLIKIKDSVSPVAPPSAAAAVPTIQLDGVSFKRISFNYRNDVSALAAFFNIGELTTHPENINLQNLNVKLKDFVFNNSIIKVGLGKSPEAKATKDVVAAKTDSQLNNPWKFELTKLDLNNNEIIYNDDNSKPLAEGFDASHLHITNFMFNGDSMNFTPAVFQGNINQLAFNEKSGLHLQKFHTRFYYSDSGASLTDLLLQTDGTLIQNQLIVKYPSIKAASKNMGSVYVDVNLPNSRIAVKDILAFMPSYKRNMQAYKVSVIKINASAKGYLKDISIPVFELSGYGDTYVKLSGRLQGLPDTKRAYYNVNINQFTSTKRDLLSFVPKGSMPSNVNLPDRLSLTGFFKGTMSAFATKLNLKTNRGNINLDGSMKPGNVYAIKASLQNVDAGYLSKQPQNVGVITANVSASGSGFNPKTANAKYVLNVVSAQVKGYTYKDLNVDGTIDHGVDHTTASIHDANISLNLDATADLHSTYPPLKLDLLIDTLNAKALNLMTDTLSLSGHIVADMPSTNPDDLVGTLNVTNLSLTQAGQTLHTDSLSLVASGAPENKSIVINSDNALNASLVGQYKLTEMAQALQQIINQYYNLPGYQRQNIAAENWQFNATIHPQGIILQLAPQLKGSDSIVLGAHLNTAQNDLGLTAKSQRIIFGTNQIDSLNLTAQTTVNSLDANVSINGAKAGSNHLYKTNIKASVANNQLNADVDAKDQKGNSQYVLGALLQQVGGGFKVSLKPDLLLDYSKWNVAQGNSIQYDSTGVIVNSFSISQGNQSINVNSTAQSVTAPIRVDLKNFEIATIAKLAHQDSLLASGTINGTAEITNPTKNMVFTSNITVNNLTYKLDTIGNVAIKVNNQTANAYNVDVAVTGNGNDVRLTGNYYTGDGKMDLNLLMNSLNLSIVKPFAVGQLDDITGILKGNVKIQGTATNPQVDGNFNFQNASLVPTISGERFTLPDDAITVNSTGIHFNKFTLLDSAGNKAILSGDIGTTDFKTYTFNLTLHANHFTLVNTEMGTDKIVYGKLNINADADITGDMASPKVSGTLRVNKETDFALVLPQTDPEVVSRNGVVNFVDPNHPVDTVSTSNKIDSLAMSKVTGADISANIITDSLAKFTVVVDQRNGDMLTLKGAANLNGGIDKSGKVTLTGSYILSSGSYNLSLSVLKRQFLIQQGSTITWTGDPTQADIDVTALYTANTAPIDLMQSSLEGRSTEEVTKYKQKLPFQVALHMRGQLLKPIISFDITLPDRQATQWQDVATKLDQVRGDENELNKQVFALLLLGHFVQENPFASSGGGGGIENSVRESASRILTDQLNNLAGSLIKGVDINFGLTSGTDYSTGAAANRTDLNVTVSKKLLNDRLRVNVGSNFELEGPSSAGENASNPAGDVSVDYQLTRDGRYLIRVYRYNDYEGVIYGQVIETGASFILSFDYNKLSQIFNGRKEAKKIRKENKKITKEDEQIKQQQEQQESSTQQPPVKNP